MWYKLTPGILAGAVLSALLISPAEAQSARAVRKDPLSTALDVISARGCPRPADAKDAQVIAFEKGSLETKLAVSLGNGEFKVVNIKIWDRPDDPRPVISVIEALSIMQGRLQFYTPELNTDPESTSNTFILITEMRGPHVCWATPSALLSEGAYAVSTDAKAETAPSAAIAPSGEATPKVQ